MADLRPAVQEEPSDLATENAAKSKPIVESTPSVEMEMSEVECDIIVDRMVQVAKTAARDLGSQANSSWMPCR